MTVNFTGLYRKHHPQPTTILMHTHPNHELIYYLKGDGFIHINNLEYGYSPGDICITKAGTPHDEVNPEESLRVFLFFEASEDHIIEGMYRDTGSFRAIINKMQRESSEALPHQKEMLDILLTQLLIEIQRLDQCTSPKVQNWANVLKYIEENICTEVDFGHLARLMCCSYERFRHIFKERTGHSPNAYITAKRVELAKMLIYQNEMLPLTRIAYDCGFSSPSQFSNAFRAKTGISPSSYQIRCRLDQ